MDIINLKFKKAISRLLYKQSKLFDKNTRDVAVITFDGTSLVHKTLEKIILRGYGSISRTPPSIIYKSLPRIMELLSTKRKDIQNIRTHIEMIPDL